ncbi:hypothetical protein EVAR_16717_1 [Eumeta japonica]|uniref:Uncharacterized protein n=1 Tax=Eumeta variegata TaxID=151549 RepID=A0A4C1V521_EUMVA|nr:hypothetical protein EVAR_16717_1 [Eumeta japonica]
MTPKLNNRTVWVFQDEPNPTKIIRAKSTLKRIIACFFADEAACGCARNDCDAVTIRPTPTCELRCHLLHYLVSNDC